MAARKVPIQLSYLLCPELTASAKVVWMAFQLDPERTPSQREISRLTGISRPTVSKAVGRLEQPCRPYTPPRLEALRDTRVWVDRDLITDKRLPAMARVVYCVLLGLGRLGRSDVMASYARLAGVLRVQARTVRGAVLRLVEAGWLAISQRSQRAPIRFSFPNPKTARQAAEVRRAEQRFEKAKYKGEALALLWCDYLVDSTNFLDDYFPQWLTNPYTNQLLQADRYYFDQNVAIEFNGPQHDGPTEWFSERTAQAQIDRDRMKQEISKRLDIALVTLRPEDLTFKRMKEVLGKFLPLRPVSATEPIIAFLERKSREYREAIGRALRRRRRVKTATPVHAKAS